MTVLLTVLIAAAAYGAVRAQQHPLAAVQSAGPTPSPSFPLKPIPSAVPSPTRWVRTPMVSRAFKACLKELRWTPNRSANSRSEGSREPSARLPSDIKPFRTEINVLVKPAFDLSAMKEF